MDAHPPWRTGTQVGRTMYNAQEPGDGDKVGRLIGVMDSPELAHICISAVNAQARIHAVALPQRHDPALWLKPATARENYIQRALMDLHAAIGAPEPLRKRSAPPGAPEPESPPSDPSGSPSPPGGPSQGLGGA